MYIPCFCKIITPRGRSPRGGLKDKSQFFVIGKWKQWKPAKKTQKWQKCTKKIIFSWLLIKTELIKSIRLTHQKFCKPWRNQSFMRIRTNIDSFKHLSFCHKHLNSKVIQASIFLPKWNNLTGFYKRKILNLVLVFISLHHSQSLTLSNGR